MKDEIKEILDKFDKVLENYELDKKWGQMSVDSICHLFPSEMVAIKDYITNLQEENSKLKERKYYKFYKYENNSEGSDYCFCERPCDSNMSLYCFWENGEICGFMSETLVYRHPEIKEISMNEFMYNFVRPIIKENFVYKSRNEKAIEYCNKEIGNIIANFDYVDTKDLENVRKILQGEDKDVKAKR